MQHEVAARIKRLDPRKRNIVIAAIALVIFILIFVIMQFLTGPQRSVTAYCQTYKEEKARLAQLPGDTWPTGVFNDELNDAGEIATSFGRLEKVAPDEIRSDVATLQSIYQKIDSDPSRAIDASLSGLTAEESIKKWTYQYCKL